MTITLNGMEMIGVVDRNKLSNIDALGDELDCLVSDDRFELIRLFIDKLENIEQGESVVVSYVKNTEDTARELISVICDTST